MKSVLLVENEINLLEGLTVLIEWEQCGFQITDKAVNGLQALEKMQTRRFDLVVTDIRMPVMSGLQLLRALRSVGNQVPFILISGYRDFQYAKAAIDYDAQGYLLKPIDKQELIGTLNRLTEKNAFDVGEWNVPRLETRDESSNEEEMETEVKQICQYVFEHYSEDITLSTLAKIFFVNPAYLGQQFRKVMGVTFSDFLANYRIQQAILLMKNSNRKLNDISMSCGFNSLAHFDRCFIKFMGVSPSEYRRNESV